MQSTTAVRWPPRIVAILLLLAAAPVIVGITVESAQRHTETSVTSEHTESGDGHVEPGTGAGLEGATLLGIPLESPLFIGGLAVGSLVLAATIWFRPARATAVLVIAFSIGAGAFDIAEIQHQATDGAGGLLAVAALVVALRVLAIAGSVMVLRERVTQLRAGAADLAVPNL